LRFSPLRDHIPTDMFVRLQFHIKGACSEINLSRWGWCSVCSLLFFLVLEEENAALIHHLPVHCAGDCLFASASASDCRLVVQASTSSSVTI
jgi:hypothetical protein